MKHALQSTGAVALAACMGLAALGFETGSVLAAGPASTMPPVTEQEAVAAGKRLETSIAQRNGLTLDDFLDGKELVDRSTAGIDAPKVLKNGFAIGLLPQLSLGTQLIKVLVPGGSFRFLRVRGTPEDRTILFRVSGPGGLNYQEYHLIHSPTDGKVAADDVEFYNTGEPLSASIRRFYIPIAAAEAARNGAGAPKAGLAADLMAHGGELEQLTQLTTAHKAAEALTVYDGLPASMKKLKTVMIFRITNAARIGPKEHRAALADYDAMFPDDTAGPLIHIDVAFIDKDWVALDKALSELDRQVGGDPFLDYYRAKALVAQEKPADAKTLLTALVAKEPHVAAPYYTLIDLSLKDKAFAETARLLTSAEKNLHLKYGDADKKPLFAEFAASEDGKKFFAAPPRRRPGP